MFTTIQMCFEIHDNIECSATFHNRSSWNSNENMTKLLLITWNCKSRVIILATRTFSHSYNKSLDSFLVFNLNCFYHWISPSVVNTIRRAKFKSSSVENISIFFFLLSFFLFSNSAYPPATTKKHHHKL